MHVCIHTHTHTKVKCTHVQLLFPSGLSSLHSNAALETPPRNIIQRAQYLLALPSMKLYFSDTKNGPFGENSLLLSQRMIVANAIYFVFALCRASFSMLFMGPLSPSSQQSEQKCSYPHFADENTKARAA